MEIRLIILDYATTDTRGGGTQEDRHASEWKGLFKRVGSISREIH